ncbi:MAG: hypothetical protein AAGI23_18405 [Bacteroidota bacterium]
MKDNYNINEIEAYLNKEMSEAERIAFEQRLEVDGELAKEVEFHRAVVGGIDKAGVLDFRVMVGEVHQELKGEQFFEAKTVAQKPETKVRTMRFGRRRILSIAASFAVLLVAAWWLFLRPISPEQLYANNFELPDNQLTTQIEDRLAATGFGTNKSALRTLEEAMTEFETGNYVKAISGFRAFKTAAPQDGLVAQASLYEAVALLELNEVTEAQNLLLDLVQNDASTLQEDAQWYLALSYLKIENTATALEWLNQLNDSAEYGTEAQRLIQKLK